LAAAVAPAATPPTITIFSIFIDVFLVFPFLFPIDGTKLEQIILNYNSITNKLF
jgi:hypothetical protein